jgi:hypothetical protein
MRPSVKHAIAGKRFALGAQALHILLRIHDVLCMDFGDPAVFPFDPYCLLCKDDAGPAQRTLVGQLDRQQTTFRSIAYFDVEGRPRSRTQFGYCQLLIGELIVFPKFRGQLTWVWLPRNDDIAFSLFYGPKYPILIAVRCK